MDIRSKSSPSEATGVYEARSRAEAEARAQKERELRVRRAEEEAQQRIEEAEQNADSVVQDIEKRSNTQQTAAKARLESERDYIREQLKQTQTEGYKQLREMKRKMDAEAGMALKNGEQTKGQLKAHYQRTMDETAKSSGKAVREAYMRNLQEFQRQEAWAKEQKEVNRDVHDTELKTQQKLHEDAKTAQTERFKAETEALRKKTEHARSVVQKKFNEQFKQNLGQHQQSIDNLNARAGKQLETLRNEGARKLAAYESRQEDPFYRMVNLEAHLHDSEHAFILRARIPPHEQENVKAMVQGNQIVLTGSRQSQDQVHVSEGRARSSSTYQTFRETFPIDWPVDAKSMLREANDDELLFIFPKKAGMVDPETGTKKPLEGAPVASQRAPRPDFPENLVTPAPPFKGPPIT